MTVAVPDGMVLRVVRAVLPPADLAGQVDLADPAGKADRVDPVPHVAAVGRARIAIAGHVVTRVDGAGNAVNQW